MKYTIIIVNIQNIFNNRGTSDKKLWYDFHSYIQVCEFSKYNITFYVCLVYQLASCNYMMCYKIIFIIELVGEVEQ